MALTLLAPGFGPVVFAKNPVIYKIQSFDGMSQPYAAQGAKTKVQAGAGARFSTGETLTVTYTEPDGTSEVVVFTAAADYTAESAIPDSSFSGSISAYWEAVKTKVGGHHRIAPYFSIKRAGPLGGNSLTLSSRSSDPAWEVAFTTSASFTITDTAAVDDTTPINYSILFEVFVERTYQGGDYALAAQLKNFPDTDGFLSFDISSILEAECRAGLSEPVVPEWGTTAPIPGDNLRRFYVRFTEVYGTPIEAQEWEYDEVRTCMNGGVSQSIWANGDWLADRSATDSLLTWMPDGRKLGLEQPEFLAWYNWDTEAREVLVEMKWTSVVDGSVSTPTTHLTPLLTAAKGVALLPVGVALLGLDTEADAYKYQVRVVYDDGGTPVAMSQWRTYLIDRDYHHSERYVQYLNGFGVPECWRCTGVWSKKLNVQRSVAERPLLPDFNELASDKFQYASVWDHELTYRTGYLRRGEADVLQEMLLAGEVYDVAESGYVPLLIQTNSFAVTDSEEDLHAYQFAAQPRLNTKNFSKTEITTLLTGAWQEPGGEAWFDAVLIPWELP